jgi:acarbose 7IV-phosphotransferase
MPCPSLCHGHFFAGVLFGHTRGYPPQQCLRLGALMSGLCVTTEELALPTLTHTLLAAEYQRVYGEHL